MTYKLFPVGDRETLVKYVQLSDGSYAQVMAVVSPDGSLISGGGGGGSQAGSLDQDMLDVQTDTLAFLGQMLPSMVDTSYETTVTAITYANTYRSISNPTWVYSQRFDIGGVESWYLENPNGTAGQVPNLNASDPDLVLFSEGLVQSVTYVRTLIGSSPAITSQRTVQYSLAAPYWVMLDTGWA